MLENSPVGASGTRSRPYRTAHSRHSIAVASLILLYIVPPTVSFGPIWIRDFVVFMFGLVLLRWLWKSTTLRGMLLPIGLDLLLLLLILVSAIGHPPWNYALLAEAAACLVVLAAGIALGDMQGFLQPVQVVRLIVFGLAVASLIWWVASRGNAPILSLSEDRRSQLEMGSNGLGAFLAIGITLEVAARWRRLTRPSAILVLSVLLAATLATGSRGALITLAIGLFSFLLLMVKRKGLAIVLGFCLAFATLASVRLVTESRYGTTESSFAQSSQRARLEAWNLALHLIPAHPLDGVGYGRVALYGSSDPRIGFELDTHNEFLRIGAESGLPALLVLLWLFGYCLWRGARLTATDGRLAAGMFAGFASFVCSLLLVQGFKSFAFSAPWMLFAGLMVGTHPDPGNGANRPAALDRPGKTVG